MSSALRRSHLALAISSALAVSTLHAATITVDTLADPGTDGGECSLRNAIEAINTQMPVYGCNAGDGIDDTIVFADSLGGTISLESGQLVILDDMAIEGPGADVLTLDAGGSSRVMRVTDFSTVSISGLTMTGGSDKYGGGIYIISESSLSLSDCVVTGNQADSYGGGIEVFGNSFLELDNCLISDNSAGQAGGGIAVTISEAIIRNSTISGNVAGEAGGGLRVLSNRYEYFEEAPEVAGSRRLGSTRGSNGESDSSRLEVIGSLVTGNTADLGGGIAATGAYYGSGGFSDDEPLIDRFLAHQGTKDTGNQGLRGGNGSVLFETNLVVADTTISDNEAYFGGGIGAFGFIDDEDPDVLVIETNVIEIIDGSLITGNFGFELGGGIGAKYGSTALVESSVAGNFTYGAGAGVANLGYGINGTTLVADMDQRWADLQADRGINGEPGPEISSGRFFSKYSSISGNEIVEFDSDGSPEPLGSSSISLGGGLFNAAGISYLISTEVSDNISLKYGGGVGSLAGAVIGVASQFSNNTGGGLVGIDEGVLATVLSQVEGNHGAPVGGLWCEGLYFCGAVYSSISNNEGSLAGGVGAELGIGGEIIAGHDQPFGRGEPAGFLFLENSTVSGNAGGVFGGIGAPNVQLRHSTVAFNSQDSELQEPVIRGGGYGYDFPNAGGVGTTSYSQIFHSIISDNTSTDGSADLETDSDNPIFITYSLIRDNSGFTPNVAGTGNIFDEDPLLGPLDFNDGKYSQTHALLSGSPAIDAGDPGLDDNDLPDYDQRGPGFDRIVEDIVDIGAYEFQGLPPQPGIALSLSEIDFGDVLVGTSAAVELTITSIGDAALELGSLGFGFEVVIAGISLDGFSMANDTCSNEMLAPTESCTVDVVFEPEARDVYQATLLVPSNADDNGPETVALSGTGVAPVMAIMPAAIDFGDVPFNDTTFDSVALTNVGDAPLEINGTDVAAPFGLSTDMGLCLASVPTVLAPSESCNLEFSFTPTAEIFYSQTVEVFSDSLGGDSTVLLEGTGFEAEPPPPPVEDDPPHPVPTMSRIATGVLGGGLLLLGWLGLRRRIEI